MLRVTVWGEFYQEQCQDDSPIHTLYPDGIHLFLKRALETDESLSVRTATLQEPECGLTEAALAETDVLVWWGHVRHDAVPDAVVARVQQAVLKGMGIVFLHSAHHSKPFKALMGTSCNLCWREDGDLERLWVVNPAHPIAKGLGRYVEIPHEEMYSEPFQIPEPDELVFLGWFEGGEAFRAGCCWRRGNGKVFYFQPGHETYATYHLPEVQTILKNAVHWCAPDLRVEELSCPHVDQIR